MLPLQIFGGVLFVFGASAEAAMHGSCDLKTQYLVSVVDLNGLFVIQCLSMLSLSL